jgi:hypothetical protein
MGLQQEETFSIFFSRFKGHDDLKNFPGAGEVVDLCTALKMKVYSIFQTGLVIFSRHKIKY